MKRDVYYRIQSSIYDVGPESTSWFSTFSNIKDAMKADIVEWKAEDRYTEKDLNETGDNLSVKEKWAEYTERGRKSKRVQPGLSCFINFGQLLLYWDELYEDLGGIDYLLSDELEEGYYVLVFEGEHVGEGSAGEDCVKFIREIERVEISDIYPVVEFLQHFKEHARELLLYGSYDSVDELLYIIGSYSDEDWIAYGMND